MPRHAGVVDPFGRKFLVSWTPERCCVPCSTFGCAPPPVSAGPACVCRGHLHGCCRVRTILAGCPNPRMLRCLRGGGCGQPGSMVPVRNGSRSDVLSAPVCVVVSTLLSDTLHNVHGRQGCAASSCMPSCRTCLLRCALGAQIAGSQHVQGIAAATACAGCHRFFVHGLILPVGWRGCADSRSACAVGR